MTNIIKIKANDAVARGMLVTALANCGYKVWIEENKRQRRLDDTLFYVCYSEVEEVEVHDDSGIASNCRSYPINIDNCY